MSEWIKYDGTNRPDDGVLVRIRQDDGWESVAYAESQNWVWCSQINGAHVTHFMLKESVQ